MRTLAFPRVPSDARWSNRHPIELCYRHEVFRIIFIICKRSRFKDLARLITEFIKIDQNSALRSRYDPRDISQLVSADLDATWSRLREETRESVRFALIHVVLRGPDGNVYPRSAELRSVFLGRVLQFTNKRHLAIDRGDVTKLTQSKEDPGSGACFYVDKWKHLKFHMWAIDQPSPTVQVMYEGSVRVNYLVRTEDLI
jgi:hypothetical protein